MNRKVKAPAKPPDSFSSKDARRAVRAIINYPDYYDFKNSPEAVRDREKRIKMLWTHWNDLAKIADIQSELIDAKEENIKLLEEQTALLKKHHELFKNKIALKMTKMESVMGWRKVKDELPETNIDVLGWDGKQIGICYHNGVVNNVFDKSLCYIDWETPFGMSADVTHWMPLPQKP